MTLIEAICVVGAGWKESGKDLYERAQQLIADEAKRVMLKDQLRKTQDALAKLNQAAEANGEEL